MADLEDYDWLTSPDASRWLTEFAESDESSLRLLGRLRKVLSSEKARLVVDQIALRRRATAKFGSVAHRLFFTDLGLQQSTDRWIASYKASRLQPATPVVDYCCGIGGDLLSLAERCAVVGWDRDPAVAHFAAANVRQAERPGRAEVRVGNVEELLPSAEETWHLDPDRRVGGRRSTQVQWHSPGPELIERWLEVAPHGILKLAPAAQVPEGWHARAELEWLSRDRECRQLVLWFGDLAPSAGLRRATKVEREADDDSRFATYSFVGDPRMAAPLADQLQRYVIETDSAIRAAGLTGAFAAENNLLAMATGTSYLTGACPVAHPLVACFEVVDHFALRVGTLKKYLQSRGVGRLEIKQSGVKTDVSQLRKKLKLRGSGSATLLLSRLGSREVAMLAKRCGPIEPLTG